MHRRYVAFARHGGDFTPRFVVVDDYRWVIDSLPSVEHRGRILEAVDALIRLGRPVGMHVTLFASDVPHHITLQQLAHSALVLFGHIDGARLLATYLGVDPTTFMNNHALPLGYATYYGFHRGGVPVRIERPAA